MLAENVRPPGSETKAFGIQGTAGSMSFMFKLVLIVSQVLSRDEDVDTQWICVTAEEF